MTQIYTTLKKIKAKSPCESGWVKLLKGLGKTQADDEPLAFSTITEHNGVKDALWCLRSICPEHDKEVRLFAADCAERVLHIFEKKYPNDDRPRKAIQAARDFANGLITYEERSAAYAAAYAAADSAADAASDAASDAAYAAAFAAADATTAAYAAYAAYADAAAERKIQAKMLKERFS